MRFILLALSFFLFTLFSLGQKKNNVHQLFAKDKMIRLNLSSFIDPIETNASVGFEYRLKDNVSVTMDVGYIFYSEYYSQRNKDKTDGFIFKPAIRYYTDEDKKFYIEGEFLIKTVTNKITDWIGRDCANNVSSYQEYTTFKIRKNVYGFNFKIGYQARLSKNDLLWLEPYLGIGIKYKKEFLVNEKNSCYNFSSIGRNLRTPSNNSETVVPNLPFGLRLLFKL
jgi:Protein of unknown function (DUF3575)